MTPCVYDETESTVPHAYETLCDLCSSVGCILFGALMEKKLPDGSGNYKNMKHTAGIRTSLKQEVKKEKARLILQNLSTRPLWVHTFLLFRARVLLWNVRVVKFSTSREHKLFLLPVGFISTESFTWNSKIFSVGRSGCNESLFMNKGVFSPAEAISHYLGSHCDMYGGSQATEKIR